MDFSIQWPTTLARPGPDLIDSFLKGKRTIAMASLLVLFIPFAVCGCGQRETSQKYLDDMSEKTTIVTEYSDIEDHYAEQAILDGLQRGLWSVPADGLFRPDEAATAEEFLTALWNASGRPEDGVRVSDKADDATRALSWAEKEGWLKESTRDIPLTRQDAMNILYAHNGGVSGIEAMLTAIYDEGFPDSGEVSPEGKAALYWGFYNVLIRERDQGRIEPDGIVSRGDMAEMLIQYMDDFITGVSTE